MPRRKGKPKKAPAKARGLTVQQQRFVDALLGQANGSATEAARIAGYASPEAQAYRVLEIVGVRAEINRRLDAEAMPANEVLARLSRHAVTTLDDCIDIDSNGEPKLNLKKARDAGKLGLIKKLSPTRYGYTIELYDAQAALVQLGRYHGLFVDRHEHDFSRLSDEELIARAKGALGGDGEARSDAPKR